MPAPDANGVVPRRFTGTWIDAKSWPLTGPLPNPDKVGSDVTNVVQEASVAARHGRMRGVAAWRRNRSALRRARVVASLDRHGDLGGHARDAT